MVTKITYWNQSSDTMIKGVLRYHKAAHIKNEEYQKVVEILRRYGLRVEDVVEARNGSLKLRRGQVMDLKQRLAAKRGHTPQLEAVAVISCKTGEILDFEITSKYCEKCKRCTKLSQHNRNFENGGKRTRYKLM